MTFQGDAELREAFQNFEEGRETAIILELPLDLIRVE